MKGLRSTSWLLQNSHRYVKYSIGDVVNNVLITILMSDGYEFYCDHHLVSCVMSNYWGVHLKVI